MSKRSKARRRQMEAERLARLVKDTPITGHFEERVTEIAATEANGQQVGHGTVAPPVDRRLPVYYHGNGHYVSSGNDSHQQQLGWFRGQASPNVKLSDIGYKPIGHDSDKGIFRVNSADITEGQCPIAKIPKVYVAARLWNEWISLAEDYNTEWLAYLTGQFVKDDRGPRYEIRKMYFPPQVAHSSHVDVDDDFTEYLPNTVGAIHSHVGMAVFFSAEDLRHSNWPVEIVVNAKGEAKVMIRHQLECGQWIKNYSEILTVGDASDNRYVMALDKAFESGERLRQARVKDKQVAVGYRTPEIDNSVSVSNPSRPTIASYDPNKEWHFHINGRPHRWNEKLEQYVEVVKVDGKWVDKEDEKVNVIKTPLNSLTMAEQEDIMSASVEIDENTGQIIMTRDTNSDDGSQVDITDATGTRPATQEEIDRMMEAEVDSVSCGECSGTGKVDSNNGDMIVQIECVSCGGTGLRPEIGWPGGYGSVC
jgi:proteasome lid subunit RPN8/RPN11